MAGGGNPHGENPKTVFLAIGAVDYSVVKDLASGARCRDDLHTTAERVNVGFSLTGK